MGTSSSRGNLLFVAVERFGRVGRGTRSTRAPSPRRVRVGAAAKTRRGRRRDAPSRAERSLAAENRGGRGKMGAPAEGSDDRSGTKGDDRSGTKGDDRSGTIPKEDDDVSRVPAFVSAAADDAAIRRRAPSATIAPPSGAARVRSRPESAPVPGPGHYAPESASAATRPSAPAVAFGEFSPAEIPRAVRIRSPELVPLTPPSLWISIPRRSRVAWWAASRSTEPRRASRSRRRRTRAPSLENLSRDVGGVDGGGGSAGARRRRRFGGFRRAASPLPRARVSPRGGRGVVVEERVEARVFRHRGSNSRSSRGFSRGDSRRRWRRRRTRSARGSPPRRRRARNTSLSIFQRRFPPLHRTIRRSIADPSRGTPRRTVLRTNSRGVAPPAAGRLAHSRNRRSRRGRRNPREKSRDGGDARLTAPRDVPRRRGARFPTKSDARDGIQPRGGSMARERSSTTGRCAKFASAAARRARRRRWTPTTTRAPSKTRTKVPRGSPSRRRARRTRRRDRARPRGRSFPSR